MPVDQLACEQANCPLLASGICLDAFPDPNDCPHSFIRAEGDVVDAPLEPIVEEAATSLDQPEFVYVGGDQALDIGDANDLVGRRATRVILLAGEAESGKTTLIVELFARFLHESFSGWSFAGSLTLRALDDRHRPSRVSSGAAVASTDRTQDEDMRLLHLEIGASKRRVNFLMSDLKGELFENIRNGASVLVEVPIANRADACVLLVDGEDLVSASGRASAAFRARQLLGGLSEPGGLKEGTEIMIIVTKSDLLDKPAIQLAKQLLGQLQQSAADRGLSPAAMLVSARPKTPDAAQQNLDKFLDWLTHPPVSVAPQTNLRNEDSDRYLWRAEGGSSG